MLRGLLARTRRYLAVLAILVAILVASIVLALGLPSGIVHDVSVNVVASVVLLVAGVYVLDDLVARSRRAELGAYSAFMRKRIAWTADWWPQVAERIVSAEIHPHPHAPDALRWLIAHAPFVVQECAPCLRDAQRIAERARADLAQLGARWAEVAPADELELIAAYEDSLVELSNGLGNVAHQLEHPDLPGPRDSTPVLTETFNRAIRDGATKALALFEHMHRELRLTK